MAIEKEGLSGDRVQQEEVAWGEDVLSRYKCLFMLNVDNIIG